MANIHQSIAELVGKTPLLQLNGYNKAKNLKANIIAKLEYFNPNQSVKDRIALAMVETAEREGKLKKGDTIIELTSGNTGVGLAAIAAAKGYPFRVYIQDQVSKERFQVIHALGGKTVKLSEVPEIVESFEKYGPDFIKGVEALERHVAGEKNLWFADQTRNPANPNIHFQTTGPEIWNDTDGKVDVFVACVGTGGTLSGVGNFRYFSIITEEEHSQIADLVTSLETCSQQRIPSSHRSVQTKRRSRVSIRSRTPRRSISLPTWTAKYTMVISRSTPTKPTKPRASWRRVMVY